MSGSHGGWKTRLGDQLPARWGIPLRARFGPAREAEMALVETLVPRGALCVDVGANKGTWTEALRRTVGSTGTVVAVEPQPVLAAYLKKGFGWTSVVEIHECALSDAPGTVALSIPLESGRPVRGHATLSSVAGEREIVNVKVRTLDEILGSRMPAFVKIDVEGHELGVVEGMRGLLARARPAMVIEMMDEDPMGTTAECFAQLTQRFGYVAARLEAGELQEVPSWPVPGWRASPNVVFLQQLPSASR